MLNGWQVISKQTHQHHQQFIATCKHTQVTQQRLLFELLAVNGNSQIGKRLGFANIKSIQQFQHCVPIRHYSQMQSDMDAQMAGTPQLSTERVHFYELTSGSTEGAKHVPYTGNGFRSLQQAVEAWLADLITERPQIANGPAYWSISPPVKQARHTADGTPVGAESDLDFMRDELKSGFAQTLLDSSALSNMTSYDDWQFLTLLSLVMEENLRLISVWSPSFLTALLDALPRHFEKLLATLTTPPNSLNALLGNTDRTLNAVNRLTAAMQGHCTGLQVQGESGITDTAILWPHLDTISCWTHGPAATLARELTSRFPNVHVQPKGLLATEGIVSIPLCGAPQPVLTVGSGFYEFIDEHDRVFLPHELQVGSLYRVLLTNYHGFYRYDIGDWVRMCGNYGGAPMLEFVGRQGISDLTGEKLSETFVAGCLQQVFGFSLLTPLTRGYCLIVDAGHYDRQQQTILCDTIEGELIRNPQYQYARQIDQLDKVVVTGVHEPKQQYIGYYAERGLKQGDIKPQSLSTDAKLQQRLLALQT